jgi:hypothetical protein
MAKNPVELGDLHFDSKSAATEHFRKILNRYQFEKKGDRPRFSTKLNRRRGRNWGRTTSVSRAGVSGRAT